MITALQRQTVTKRNVPPVAARARSNGVRWSTRDAAGAPRPPRDASLHVRGTVPRVAPSPPRGTLHEHSFLRRQLVRVQEKRGLRHRSAGEDRRAGERRWARIIQKAAVHRGSFRQQVRKSLSSRLTGPARPGLRRVLRSPWLIIAAAVVAAVGLLLAYSGPALSGLKAANEPLVLPLPADGDPALYGLVVPAPPPRRSAGGAPVSLARLQLKQYRTQPGDTLSKVASRFGLNLDTVVSWNNIRDGRRLAAGAPLELPNTDGLKYVVRRGDTLQGIARSWGVDFNGVLDWNRLASSVISVGQELFLPGARMNPNELNKILGNLFMSPVQGRISSFFGERSDPITGVPNYHNGIDIVNRPGTPVLAAMAGTVAEVGFNYNFGNYIILKHSGQYQTLYGHLIRSLVGRGQKLQQGQTIGELGTTGYSTGPHLHFSIFHNGQPVDPLRFLK